MRHVLLLWVRLLRVAMSRCYDMLVCFDFGRIEKNINYTRISKLILKPFCIHIEETLINNFVAYYMVLRAVFTALFEQ